MFIFPHLIVYLRILALSFHAAGNTGMRLFEQAMGEGMIFTSARRTISCREIDFAAIKN